MKKRLALAVGAGMSAMATLPLFAAFEAHVINVTAQIENALRIPLDGPINFGTVFPQEHLAKKLDIELSGSFMDEGRVDDVEYIIRQKPKCGVTTLDGRVLLEGSTKTGHVIPGDNPATDGVVEEYWVDCGDVPVQFDPNTHMYGVLPALCPYISKHPDGVNDLKETVNNDGSLDSFHMPFTIEDGAVKWLDTKGRLAKSEQDTTDLWTIDLAVPCFGGFCAQDWAEFVHKINPFADPDKYTQPIANEHKVFGCDLWVEVTEVSETADICVPNTLLGYYYNLPEDHPEVGGPITGLVLGDSPFNHDWYDDKYLSFIQNDDLTNFNFPMDYFPVDDGLPGDPQYFAIHWTGKVIVPAAGDYTFNLGSDDDSWLYINGELKKDLGGIHAFAPGPTTVSLPAGESTIDIYFAERHLVQSGFTFSMPEAEICSPPKSTGN